MIVRYGSHSFENGEASMINFTAQPRRTPRNVKRSTIVTMHCAGEFCFDSSVSQNDIKSKIVAAKTALDQDYQDLKLLHNDGTTESPYVIENSHPENITGNMVLYTSWPSNMPEDYATTKQFAFAVQAEFVNPQTQLLDFSQDITIRGTTGPIKRWSRLLNNTWVSRQIHTSSTKKIIQSGYAIGFAVYPNPATPLLPEEFEHLERRVIRRVGPSAFYRTPYEHKISWRYEFETPLEFTPSNIYPGIS